MGLDYDSVKNEALAAYNTMKECISALGAYTQKMELLDKELADFTASLDNIDIQAAKIKDDGFKIMVVGEAKSGKSTFINACLGMDLLPADVRPCTGAIVEVKYGENFSAKAIYAGGSATKVIGETAVRNFLKKNTVLSGDYLGIPVAQINNKLLIKAGLQAYRNGTKISIAKEEVEALLKDEKIKNSNYYNLQNYNGRIKAYIRDKKNNWQNILIKIEVTLPIEELRGIELIDSPGVYAYSGAGDITLQYLKNADAVICLKPISGQALDSMQFNRFLQQVSELCNQDKLFLALTRAADLNINDLEILEEEAQKQFPALEEGHVLVVDSKAELYAQQFAYAEDIECQMAVLDEAGSMDDFICRAYTCSLYQSGRVDKDVFCKILREKSRFINVHRALAGLKQKSRYILLNNLLDSIKLAYVNLLDAYLNPFVRKFKENADAHTELQKKISELEQKAKYFQDKKNKVYQLIDKFNGANGLAKREAGEETEKCMASINAIKPELSSAFYELERLALQASKQLQQVNDGLQLRIVKEFNNKAASLNDEKVIAFKPLKSVFAEGFFEKIKGEIVSQDYENQNGCVRYVESEHFEVVKNIIFTYLQDMQYDLINNVEGFVHETAEKNIVELDEAILDRKAELNATQREDDRDERLRKVIQELSIKMVQMEKARADVELIQEALMDTLQDDN